MERRVAGSGRQLNASWVNIKFFAQPGWGYEFCHHDGWGTVSTSSHPFVIGTGSDGYDNGNIHLATGESLHVRGTYRFTLDASEGQQAAVFTARELTDEEQSIRPTYNTSTSSVCYDLGGRPSSLYQKTILVKDNKKFISSGSFR